jgi:hypothetical protein
MGHLNQLPPQKAARDKPGPFSSRRRGRPILSAAKILAAGFDRHSL